MLCQLCRKREATVHLTETGRLPEVQHRDLCQECFQGCFPSENMSQPERMEAILKLFGGPPPDEPKESK